MALPVRDRLRAFVDAEAERLGFCAAGVASAEGDVLSGERLETFIEDGHHGTMGWLPDTAERRRSPRALWPEVASIVVLAMNYGPDEDPLAILDHPTKGAISVYARNRDYHDVIKGRLKEFAGRLASRAREAGIEAPGVKVFVDTAPVMEKPLGALAGIGWQGKHTNLLSRENGSWLFLGSVFTTLDLPPDEPAQERCGSCTACLEACPTNAFPAPFRLDARRCISYLTIETAHPIPRALRPAMGNRVYGCDDCLAVCPWNKFASKASEAKLIAREDLKSPALATLLALDDAGFRALFAGSPIKRTGREKFVSNCVVAAGNSGDPAFLPQLEGLAGDPAPLVRAMAAWALGRLDRPKALTLAPRFLEDETDARVTEEWHAI